MYEVWDGDQFLFTVDTTFEADEMQEAGFKVFEREYWQQ